MQNYGKTGILLFIIIFLLYILVDTLFSYVWIFDKESFTNPIQTDYNIQYTPKGVKDIIRMIDTKNPYSSVTYVDDVTSIHPKQPCPTNYTHDPILGCIPQCTTGFQYDTKARACVPICAPYQTLKYVSDGSAICVSKCYDIEYYDLTSNKCKTCPIGYTGDGNNNCIALKPCSAGATMVDNYGTCKTCPNGQKMNQSTFECEPICKSYEQYNEDGTCTLKCPRQNQYSDPLYGCVNCPIGYLVNDQNECQPRPPCPEGEFLDNAGINCLSECPVYDKFDPTTKTCTPICSGATPIYDPLSLQCVPCPANQIYSGSYNKCIPAPTPPPPTCGPGFNMVDGQCQSMCPDWLINDPKDPLSCIPRCASNSQYYDDTMTFSCIDCPTGFTVDTYNKCTVPVPTPPPPTCGPGYTMNTDTNRCDSICPPWRTNDPKNPTSCVLLCTDPTQYYDTQNNYGCAHCPPGYGVDNNNQCTIPLPQPTTAPPLSSSSSSSAAAAAGDTGNSTGITNITLNNVSIGNTYFDGNMVSVDIFTIDIILTVVFENYNYATVSLGNNTKPMNASGATVTLTFPGVQLLPSGLTATIKYFNSSNTKVTPVATDNYQIGYKSTQTLSRNYSIQPQDFAVGYMLIGGGAGGSIGN
jgi:hypothetical protein